MANNVLKLDICKRNFFDKNTEKKSNNNNVYMNLNWIFILKCNFKYDL